MFDITKLKLVPILGAGEERIPLAEAILRGQESPATNHDKAVAEEICAAGNAGKISEEVFTVGKYALCTKDSWRYGGDRYAWYVVRGRYGFCCYCIWFDGVVDALGRFASLSE